jgi:hypothetical protein
VNIISGTAVLIRNFAKDIRDAFIRIVELRLPWDIIHAVIRMKGMAINTHGGNHQCSEEFYEG